MGWRVPLRRPVSKVKSVFFALAEKVMGIQCMDYCGFDFVRHCGSEMPYTLLVIVVFPSVRTDDSVGDW